MICTKNEAQKWNLQGSYVEMHVQNARYQCQSRGSLIHTSASYVPGFFVMHPIAPFFFMVRGNVPLSSAQLMPEKCQLIEVKVNCTQVPGPNKFNFTWKLD